MHDKITPKPDGEPDAAAKAEDDKVDITTIEELASLIQNVARSQARLEESQRQLADEFYRFKKNSIDNQQLIASKLVETKELAKGLSQKFEISKESIRDLKASVEVDQKFQQNRYQDLEDRHTRLKKQQEDMFQFQGYTSNNKGRGMEPVGLARLEPPPSGACASVTDWRLYLDDD
ncbi:MAG: hypothetical protein HQL69_20910 [Magnetococcales bacterium]|nr:hypothetical protein [Magnetococcales bacterium]